MIDDILYGTTPLKKAFALNADTGELLWMFDPFGTSLLALEASSGESIWHYQFVRHDIWDYDPPAAPNLITIERDGRMVDAVAQVTKTGFVYVFDRETGEPLFPIEEMETPSSDLRGEEAWPTQQGPLSPEPFARQYVVIAAGGGKMGTRSGDTYVAFALPE